MTNLEMFYFTGKCLTLDEHPGLRGEIIEQISDDYFDWEKFVALCSSHLILPVIYLKFRSRHILEFLPDEVLEFLREIYELNRTRNNQIIKQLHEVTGILNNANVYPVFLKGAGHLLDGLYSDVGERMMGDIDFLVPEKDFILSAKLLENDGYSMAGPCYMEIEKLKHYPGLLKAGSPAHLEIHRLPVSEDQQKWFNTELIDTEKRTVQSLEGCFVLSYKHSIIHNFIHSQLGHEGHSYGIVSFRDLYDLYLLSKRSRVEQTLPEIKCKQKAIAYFTFAGNAFGLPGKFYPTGNFSSWVFTKKHDLNRSSKAFYLTSRTIIFIIQRIFRVITQIMQSFYSRRMRQYFISRFSNRQYYTSLLHSYKGFFTRNK